MFGRLGTPEFIIIGLAILLLFGVGRISKIAGELGGGIRAFKKSLKDDEKDTGEKEEPIKD